ncbi:MAG: DUF4294 domain-containing protein [Chitinophagales bacterium]|nr:DUF4294 domain-containing protein [Chitinophagales bacterium]
MFRYSLLLLLSILYSSFFLQAQEMNPDSISVLEEIIIGNDTFPVVKVDQVQVVERKFDSNLDEMRYYRFRRKVYKVYPYAQMAKEILAEIDEEKKNSKKKRHFKKYRKDKEDALREKFEEELKKLTVTEGQILVKLINRETGNSCYRLIKELKNGFTAWLWQKVAKRYGYDLRDEYITDAPENFDLEFVIAEIEGTLSQFYGKRK